MVVDRFPRLELLGITDIELKEKSGETSVRSTLRVLVVKFVITLAPDSLVIEAVAAVLSIVNKIESLRPNRFPARSVPETARLTCESISLGTSQE